MSMPEIGEQAPWFEGVTQGGNTISLEDYRGKRLALYFYPRDNTSNCTTQACNLRDNFGKLGRHGIHVVGVSDDPVSEHEKFSEAYRLPFPLIADTEKAILNAYDAYGEKSMFGRKYMGTKRMTYLIDEKGMIRDIILKPNVGEHADEILNGFEQ
jgi:peroxiredoxin Q/BCP